MKKIGLIVLALVVAMGALGAGYAAWQDTLEIDATAEVGSFDVDFVNDYDFDNEDRWRDYGHIDTWCWNDDNARIKIENAYPGYEATAKFEVKNKGTIPARVSFDKQGYDPNDRFSTPESFYLRPGETRWVTINFALPQDFELENVEFDITYVINCTQGVGLDNEN